MLDPQPNPNPGNPGGDNPPAVPATPQQVDWAPHIPQEIAGEKLWEPLKGKPLGDVLKGYHEAQKMIGGSIRVPKDDAPPEEWAKFHQKLGVPDSPDKYQIKAPALAEGVGYSKELENKFLAAAHKTGFNNKQVQFAIDFQASMEEEKLKQNAEKRQAGVTEIEKEWGQDFARRLGLAVKAKDLLLERAGISKEDATRFFDEEGAGDHPLIMKLFHHLGEIFAEDGWIKGETGAKLQQSLQEQINAIRNDPEDPYHLKDHPKHEERVNFVSKLYERLYPQRQG